MLLHYLNSESSIRQKKAHTSDRNSILIIPKPTFVCKQKATHNRVKIKSEKEKKTSPSPPLLMPPDYIGGVTKGVTHNREEKCRMKAPPVHQMASLSGPSLSFALLLFNENTLPPPKDPINLSRLHPHPPLYSDIRFYFEVAGDERGRVGMISGGPGAIGEGRGFCFTLSV